MWGFKLVLLLHTGLAQGLDDWRNLNLLPQHIPMVFKNNPALKAECEKDSRCPYKDALKSDICWGYEETCNQRYFENFPKCPTKEELYKYWMQSDFGKLKNHLDEMKTRVICKPNGANGSSLICTKDATMCKAKNLYLHMPSLQTIQENVVLVPPDGAIGGYCELDKGKRDLETTVKRSLSTWGYQLQFYESLKFNPFDSDRDMCDVVIDKPVVFVQLDAIGNLYHHFCDFFNLYFTQQANNSWFGTDVQIVRWNAHSRFQDPFGDAWKAFTDNEVLSLRDLAWKRVCIPDATFAFLPRMAHGLYYSTYLEQNCRGSTLMKTFSDHLLHRLNVPADADEKSDVIRVTFLQRGNDKSNRKVYRRVLNMESLIRRLKKMPNFKVQVVSYDFNEMSFLEQVRVTRKTDLFIGMHGAGLTHFLFLPDWAIAFELYNCGDIRCYRDLAGLRGLRYLTWEDSSKVEEHDKDDHENYGKHAKFWNFSFDVEEFIRLVRKARDMLLENDRFRHLKNRKSEKQDKSEL